MIQVDKFSRLLLVVLVLVISSCSNDDNNFDDDPVAVDRTSLFNEVVAPDEVYGAGYVETMELDVSSEDSSLSDGSVSSPIIEGPGSGSNHQFESGVLTAGEWNDLENWNFWETLLNRQDYSDGVSKWNLKEIKRYSFQVFDKNNSYVANAEIGLQKNNVEVWRTKTDNTGKATLWSNADLEDLSASISIDGNEEVVAEVKEYANGVNIVTLNAVIVNSKKIDIYFAVDATGSMGDEIDYLKAELSNVIETAKEKNPLSEMRFGSVFYRDEGDEYVTRELSFTDDETSLVSFIKEQSARGGGDYPEAVDEALNVAITQNIWDDSASSRILFLLLDAPPHYTQAAISSLEISLIKAAEQGVKIIPITASGINKSTEYLMRSFAILTNGTYVFITDDSGVGNSHIEPTIGDYEVQKLNELLINLIDKNIP